MIIVKFFGLIYINSSIKQLYIESDSLKDVIEKILVKCPDLTKKQLLQSIIFINKKQVCGNKSLSIKLNDGDEVAFMSPSGGG